MDNNNLRLNRNFFEKNLADYKIDVANNKIKEILREKESFESLEEVSKKLNGIKLTSMELTKDVKSELGIFSEEDHKLMIVELEEIDKDNRIKEPLGTMYLYYPTTGMLGIEEINDFKFYLPTVLEAIISNDFNSYLEKKLDKKELSAQIEKNKAMLIDENTTEENRIKSLRNSFDQLPLYSMFGEVSKDRNDKLNDYIAELENAFKSVVYLNLCEVQDELDEEDLDEHTRIVKMNYFKYLSTNSLDSIYFDYEIDGNNLMTSVYLTDVYQILTIKIIKVFEDVFKPDKVNQYSKYTDKQPLKCKTSEIYDLQVPISTKIRMITEGKKLLYSTGYEDGEMPEEVKDHFINENLVYTINSPNTSTEKLYRLFLTMNFFKTFAEYDKEIYTNGEAILKWLPRVITKIKMEGN